MVGEEAAQAAQKQYRATLPLSRVATHRAPQEAMVAQLARGSLLLLVQAQAQA